MEKMKNLEEIQPLTDDGFWESSFIEEWEQWEPYPIDLFLNDEDITPV